MKDILWPQDFLFLTFLSSKWRKYIVQVLTLPTPNSGPQNTMRVKDVEMTFKSHRWEGDYMQVGVNKHRRSRV